MKRLLQTWIAALLLLVGGAAWAADQLGAGDVVKVYVYGNPDLGLETRISDAGTITFPLIGQVKVADMPVASAEKKIASLLQSGGYLQKPQVTIIVTQVQSQAVSVLGQVNRPGRYPLEGGKRSLTDLLAQAGGVNADGGDELVLIRNRDGKVTRERVDLVQMVRGGELVQNVGLSAGDVIFVERAPRVYIYGEVQRPGALRLERDMTLTQALSAGGGLTLRGTHRGITIKRRTANGGFETIKPGQDEVLRADDVIHVKESWF
jgi:polysaccharide export outer membrane protein